MKLIPEVSTTKETPLPQTKTDLGSDGVIPRLSDAVSQLQLPQVPKTEAPKELEVEKCIRESKMLLVDDNHINLKVLSAYMKKIGRDYVAVVNGKLAVDAYIQQPEDFAGILMDISMPVMDGLEASRLIREFERRSGRLSIPILVLTGLASDSTHQEALESGVDVFLTKPVRLKALSEAMESMNIMSLV